MNLYEMYEMDENVEKDGIVLDYGDAKIRIARAGGSNQKYNKTIARLSKPHKRSIQTETIDLKTLDALMVEAYAEAVVISWEGVNDRDGKPIAFSKKACIKLFTDLPELFADVKEQSQMSSLFAASVKEAQAGN